LHKDPLFYWLKVLKHLAQKFIFNFNLKNETCNGKATDTNINTDTGYLAMIFQKTFIQNIHITFCGVITFMCDDI